MNRTRTVAASVAVTAAVAGGIAAAAGSAQAMPTDTNTCQAGDVTAKVTEAPQEGNDKIFHITFSSADGGTCVLTGAPKGLTFYDAGGAVLGVNSHAVEPQGSHQEWVRPDNPVTVRVRTPMADEAGAPAASAKFTMANAASGVTFQVAWPDDINGTALVGSVYQ